MDRISKIEDFDLIRESFPLTSRFGVNPATVAGI
jgi:hypothetical protein